MIFFRDFCFAYFVQRASNEKHLRNSCCNHIMRLLLFILSLVVVVPVHQAYGNACGSWCGTNNDCSPSLECSRCDAPVATCVKGEPCGAACNVTTDCNQASNCTQCVLGVCVAGCGQPCNGTRDCLGYGCNACMDGICVLWQCGRYCTTDTPCQVGGFPGCGTCDHNSPEGVGTCRSTCGGQCDDGAQCPSRCPFCIGGQCTVTQP